MMPGGGMEDLLGALAPALGSEAAPGVPEQPEPSYAAVPFKLAYDSPKHKKLRDALRNRIQASRRKLADWEKKWRESEDMYYAYVKETDEDAVRRAARDAGKPQYTTITIPYSYAILLTAHTYWASVFLGRSPVLQFNGRHGEAEEQVQCIDALVDYQVTVGGMLPVFYHWLLDYGRFGYGVVGHYWCREKHKRTRLTTGPKRVSGIEVPFTTTTNREVEEIDGYIGNRLYNIAPRDFIWDPRVSLINFQDGEWAGRAIRIGWNQVVRREREGYYFNVSELARSSRNYADCRIGGSQKATYPAESGDFSYSDDGLRISNTRPAIIDGYEIVMEVIPREFGLGDNDYPEKWVFTLAFDDVIIGCQPLDEYHGKFPYAVQAYECDPYVLAPRGLLELLKPLNEVLDWLFNSHIFNVRSALNNNWIVDPSKVVLRDLKDSGPGKLIRLLQSSYGTDVRTALMQIPIQDVTRQHLQSLQGIMDMVQRVSGVSDALMGMTQPQRKTATEVRTTSTAGINRLKTSTEYNSALGWSPLSQMIVQSSQQHYDVTLKLRIVGDLANNAQPMWLMVTPESIQGFFDLIPVDGTLPIDRFAQANIWKEIFQGILMVPPLAQQYDIAGIFSWMAKLAGLKNIDRFKINVLPPGMPPGPGMMPVPGTQPGANTMTGPVLGGGEPAMSGVGGTNGQY